MRDRFAILSAGAALIAVVLAWALTRSLPPQAPGPAPAPAAAETLPGQLVPVPYARAPALAAEKLPAPLERLKPNYRLKDRPGPGDWLSFFPDEGQTYDGYVTSGPTRPTAQRKAIHLVGIGTLGPAQARVVDATAEYLAALFGTLVVVDAPLETATVPRSAEWPAHGYGPQWLTGEVLSNVLIPRLPKDAIVLVGFTARDLSPGSHWNYVFGEASFEDRVAVFSLRRFGDPAASEDDFRRVLERTWKTASHELSHAFSVPHCVAYECVMNGRISLAETDLSPLQPCPVCLAKLSYALGARPAERLAACGEVARKYGFGVEAQRFRTLASLAVP